MHLYLAIQTARNKLGEQINCLRSLKSKFFVSIQEEDSEQTPV